MSRMQAQGQDDSMKVGVSGLQVAVAVLAGVEGGWLVFDGLHALVGGDYVTPSSGPYVGQLGPWSDLVRAIGLDPRSLTVRWAHVVLGAVSLTMAASLVAGFRWAPRGALLSAVATAWYAPVGTLMSVAQVLLLLRDGGRHQQR